MATRRTPLHLFAPEDWFPRSEKARCRDCGREFDLREGQEKAFGWFEAQGRVAEVERPTSRFRFCSRRPTRTDDFDPKRYPQWIPEQHREGEEKACAWLDELPGYERWLQSVGPTEAEAQAMLGWHLQLEPRLLRKVQGAAFFGPFWRKIRPPAQPGRDRLPEGVLVASYSAAKAEQRWLGPSAKAPHAH